MTHNECPLFVFHILTSKSVVLKKLDIPQDAAWKTLQSTLEGLFYFPNFCLQNEQNLTCSIFNFANSVISPLLFSYFICLFHNIFYLKKNKVHHEMQHEKVYNLRRTVYFIYAPFVFKMEQFCATNCWHNEKDHFFAHEEFHFLFH